MARKNSEDKGAKGAAREFETKTGAGGELHQIVGSRT
jgi:catalase